MSDSQPLYGRTPGEWTSLVDGCVRFLRERAALERTTNYTEVNQTLQRRHGARRFDSTLTPNGRRWAISSDLRSMRSMTRQD